MIRKFQFIGVALLSLIPIHHVLADASQMEIAAAVCLSGGCSEWGTSALHGIELAVDEVNKGGGILGKRVKLVTEDTAEATSGTTAVKVFQKLLTRKTLNYIIGPSWSPAGQALIPIVSRAKDTIVITPSMAIPDFSRASDNLFKTVPDNETTAVDIAKYAYKKGYRRCGIFSDLLLAEKYTSQVFSDAFKREGGDIVSLVETDPNDSDVSSSALER